MIDYVFVCVCFSVLIALHLEFLCNTIITSLNGIQGNSLNSSDECPFAFTLFVFKTTRYFDIEYFCLFFFFQFSSSATPIVFDNILRGDGG